MNDDNTIATMTPPDGPCEDCGAPGWKGECPYAADVHNEHVEVILCAACSYARAQDI